MAYIGVQPTAGQYRKLDDISGSFNGSTTTFTTSVAGENVTAATPQQLLVSVGGVIQQPVTDYTTSTNSIIFSTAPASGLDFFAVLMGDSVNIGTPSDGSVTTAKLGADLTVDLASGTAAAPSLTFDSNTGLFSPGADEVAISTGGTQRATVDSSGRLLVGTSSAVSTFNYAGGDRVPRFQVFGDNTDNGSLAVIRTQTAPSVFFGGGASGTNVASGNNIGGIVFTGYHTDKYYTGAFIAAEVDGTPGANDMPGRLVFSTTADGASSPTERMRINSGGKLTAPGVYAGTTTGGGPVYVESDGDLLRFTSSRKYKTDIETLEDFRADAILNCRPVWYRSLSANDIKTEGADKSEWGWYGFIAEEVAEIDPRLVNWATKDAVVQEDGSTKSVERDPADYEAEGVRYETFVPLLLNLIKRQQQAIEELQTEVAALKAQ